VSRPLTKEVTVTQRVHVTVDQDKFDEDFFAEFRSTHYDFHTLDEHVAHLAQLHARGLANDHCFIEGYGNAREMGISFFVTRGSTETEVGS
jgi:hypothetical protein